MTGTGGGSSDARHAVELALPQAEAAAGRYRALEAWRGAGGHGLCYFLALADGEPADDDRADRRAVLEPGETPASMGEDALRERLAGAVPLTVTERRFVGRDGTPWLAQNIGPVWAEGEVAAGLTGVLFTALAGPPRRVEAPGGHVADADDETLRGALAGALAEDSPAGDAAPEGRDRPASADGSGPPP